MFKLNKTICRTLLQRELGIYSERLPVLMKDDKQVATIFAGDRLMVTFAVMPNNDDTDTVLMTVSPTALPHNAVHSEFYLYYKADTLELLEGES